MSLEIPASFRLDAHGEIQRALEFDTLATLLDVQASFKDTEFCRLANDAVDLLLPCTHTMIDLYRSNAFTTSALVIAAAFHEADAEEEIRNKALRALTIRSAPQYLLGDSQEETLASFHYAAVGAHRRHPEMRDATSMVIDFHVETTQDPAMSQYSLCGSGFMIKQLDDAWARVHSVSGGNSIEATYQNEIASITADDWDSLLR